jgi:hypothetical protein
LLLNLYMTPSTHSERATGPDPSRISVLGTDDKLKGKSAHRKPSPLPLSLDNQLRERMSDAGQRALLEAFAMTAPSLRYVSIIG